MPLEGGAGEEDKALFAKAKEAHHSLKREPQARARAFKKVLARGRNDPDSLLENARARLVEELQGEFGERYARSVANALTREHAEEFLKDHGTRGKRIQAGLEEDPEVRARAFDKAMPSSNNDPDQLLQNAQNIVVEELKATLGEDEAREVAKALTREHAKEYLKNHTAQQATRRQAAIESAFHEEKGSLAATLKRARLRDRGITLEDIKTWRRENMNMERRPRRFNSWVGNAAREEYQADLFFFEDLKEREEGAASSSSGRAKKKPEEFNAGLLVVDSFSKRLAVEPLRDKTIGSLKAALLKAFDTLGGKPKMLYTDAETALTSNEIQDWLASPDVRIAHNITLRHAPLAERMIGHIKNQIIRHLSPGEKWWQVEDEVEEKYNKLHVSRSTKMTPMEASEDKNRARVKTNLEAIRRTDNPQPRLQVGDKVRRIMKKKHEKGYVPDWSEQVYTVKELKDGNVSRYLGDTVKPETYYVLEDTIPKTLPSFKRSFQRSELLLVKKAAA